MGKEGGGDGKDPPQTKLPVVEGSAARLRSGHTWVSYSPGLGGMNGHKVAEVRAAILLCLRPRHGNVDQNHFILDVAFA